MQLKQLQKETLIEKIHAWSGCEPITLWIQMQCDYHKAIKAPPL